MDDVIPENLYSALIYQDVFPDVDLKYTASGYNVKEQIIVNAAQSSYRYDFLLNLEGLTAELNEDGSVSFVDSSDNAVYKIPIPYMEDDSGAISSDVSFTLNETDQGVVLTVEADAQWINAEDRVFPVKIDPTFIIDSGSALDDIYSVYTMEAAPNDTTLGRQYLYVGAQPYSTSNDGRYRLFMHFNDLPDIPAGSEVVAANLNLYQFQCRSPGFHESTSLKMREVIDANSYTSGCGKAPLGGINHGTHLRSVCVPRDSSLQQTKRLPLTDCNKKRLFK